MFIILCDMLYLTGHLLEPVLGHLGPHQVQLLLYHAFRAAAQRWIVDVQMVQLLWISKRIQGISYMA